MTLLDHKLPSGVSGALYIAAVAILASLIYIGGAAATGLILGYLFPITFSEALAAIGLGKFALWQVSMLVATAAIVIRPIASVFK